MGTAESLLSEPEGQQDPVRRVAPPQQRRRVRVAAPTVGAAPTTNLHGIVIGLPNSGKRALLQRLEGKDPFRKAAADSEAKQSTQIAVPYHAPGNTWGETISLLVEIPTNFEVQPDFCILLINPRHDPKSLKPYVLQLLAMLVQRTKATILICVNFRDLEETSGTPPRLSQSNVKEWIDEAQLGGTIVIETGITSMRNCYGLNVLHHFIYQSYLARKRRILEQQLIQVQVETKQSKTAHQTPTSYKSFLRILEGDTGSAATAAASNRRIMPKLKVNNSAERRLNGDPPPGRQQDEVVLSKRRAPPQRRAVVPLAVTKLVFPKGADAQKALDDFFADDDDSDDDDVGRVATSTKSDNDDEDDFYYDEGGTRMGADHDGDDRDDSYKATQPKAQSKTTKRKKKRPTSLSEKDKEQAVADNKARAVLKPPEKAKSSLPTLEKTAGSTRVVEDKGTHAKPPNNSESQLLATAFGDDELADSDGGWDNDDNDLDLDSVGDEAPPAVFSDVSSPTKIAPGDKQESGKGSEEIVTGAADSPTVKVAGNELTSSPAAAPPEAAADDNQADGWDGDDDDLDIDDDSTGGESDADSEAQKGADGEEAEATPIPDEVGEATSVPDVVHDDVLELSDTVTEEMVKKVTPIANIVNNDALEDGDRPDGWGYDDLDVDDDDEDAAESEVVPNDAVRSDAIQSTNSDNNSDAKADDFMIDGSTPPSAQPTSSKISRDDSDESDDDDFMIGEAPPSPQPLPKAPLDDVVTQSDEEDEKATSQGKQIATKDNEDGLKPEASSKATSSGPSAAVLAAIQAAEQEAQLMLEQQQEAAQKKKAKKKKKKKGADGEKKRKKKSESIATLTTSEDL